MDTGTRGKGIRKIAEKIFTPIRLAMLSFLVVILTGTLLLLLPVSTTADGAMSFIDALFTATSATCVTGLTVNVVATDLTLFGHIVMLLLVQIGGLGFMSLSSAMYLFIRKKVSLRKRMHLSEDLSQTDMSDLKRMTFDIVRLTGIVELCGAVLLTAAFARHYDFGTAVWYGVFHSVMAFCNSGFDIVSENGTSLSMYSSDPFILIVIMLLIVFGGIGFVVISDVVRPRRWKKLKLHTKIMICMTGALILVGAVGFFAAEFSNPGTMGDMNVGEKILNSFFQSITSRTAGFFTIDQNSMTGFSQSLTILLMFVGVCPGSTGGGIKTATLFVLLVTVYATLRGRDQVVISRRSIGRETIAKASTVLTLAIGVAVVSMLGLSIACGSDFTFGQLLFEQVSAYATVGLSRSVTPGLNIAGKIIIILDMYIGRIGSFGFFMAFVSPSQRRSGVKYPEAGIIL